MAGHKKANQTAAEFKKKQQHKTAEIVICSTETAIVKLMWHKPNEPSHLNI